jgi:hypothetical protein
MQVWMSGGRFVCEYIGQTFFGAIGGELRPGFAPKLRVADVVKTLYTILVE